MSLIGIAGLQLQLASADNLAQLDAELDAVRRRFPWVSLVLVGELAALGPDLARAQPMPGPAEAQLAAAARRNRFWLLPGSLFEQAQGAIYNTVPVISPDGTVVARYRKMFPFTPYEQGVAGGTQYVTFDIPGVCRCGVSTCYDMWFPETTRTLASMGAELILHPSMTNTIDRDTELAIGRANAAINQCYFLDVNVAGRLGFGRSALFGPGGEVIYQAGSGHEVIAAEIDLGVVRTTRTRGWRGVTQPLKSFRDSQAGFPAHTPEGRRTSYLDSLGPLVMPLEQGRPSK